MVRLCRGDPDSAVAYLDLAALALDESEPDRLVIELWLAMLRLIRQPDDGSDSRSAGRSRKRPGHRRAGNRSTRH